MIFHDGEIGNERVYASKNLGSNFLTPLLQKIDYVIMGSIFIPTNQAPLITHLWTFEVIY